MNDITVNQNRPDNIKKLEAMRTAYTSGKKLVMLQILLTGPVTIAFAVCKIIGPSKLGFDITYWAAVTGVIISIADILLNVSVGKYKTDGANIQEQFDCDVYGMEWNIINAGTKVAGTKINQYAAKYIANPAAPLPDWYPVEVRQYPLEKAIFVCQKQALWYDRELRNRFTRICTTACIIIFILLFACGMTANLTMQHFFIGIFAPFLPALIITWKIINDHLKAIKASAALNTSIEKLDYPGSVLTMEKLRKVQDKIYCSRKDSPLIPNFFYFHHRRGLEDTMHENADSPSS